MIDLNKIGLNNFSGFHNCNQRRADIIKQLERNHITFVPSFVKYTC